MGREEHHPRERRSPSRRAARRRDRGDPKLFKGLVWPPARRLRPSIRSSAGSISSRPRTRRRTSTTTRSVPCSSVLWRGPRAGGERRGSPRTRPWCARAAPGGGRGAARLRTPRASDREPGGERRSGPRRVACARPSRATPLPPAPSPTASGLGFLPHAKTAIVSGQWRQWRPASSPSDPVRQSYAAFS
jgi:hypothetical protein